jgi:hypothetical protein
MHGKWNISDLICFTYVTLLGVTFGMCNFRCVPVNGIEIFIIFVITCIQGIYIYMHETNLDSRVHSVAAVLCLQFVLHVMLFRT